MQQGLSNWYRDKFNELSGKPDDDTWRKISGRLKETPALPPKKKRRGVVYLLSALLLINIGALFVFLFRTGAHHEPASNATNGQTIHTTNSTPVTTAPVATNHSQATSDHQVLNGNADVVHPASSSDQQILSDIPAHSSSGTNDAINEIHAGQADHINPYQHVSNDHSLTQPSFASNRTASSNLMLSNSADTATHTGVAVLEETPQMNSAATETALPVSADADQLQNDVKPVQAFYIGPAVKLQNSWLLNDQTYAGFNKHGFDQNHLFLSPVLGVQFGYMMNANFGMEGHFYLNNKYGQRYSIYTDGVLSNEKMIFYGTSTDLAVKIGIRNKGDHGLYVKGGAQLLFINRYQWITDNAVTSYNDFSYAYPSLLVVGEYDFKPFGNWQLMTGIRSNIGLRNIILSGQFLEPGFDKSLLTDLNLYISFSRRYPRKMRAQ